jgi:hypothetical protein
MKKFEQLPFDDQGKLLDAGLKILDDCNCNTLEQLAAQRGCSVRDVWRLICTNAGLEECEPWVASPKQFESGEFPPWAEVESRYPQSFKDKIQSMIDRIKKQMEEIRKSRASER